nr:MAG TPA: hypothetical protein [Caudoviricetes sp.]
MGTLERAGSDSGSFLLDAERKELKWNLSKSR